MNRNDNLLSPINRKDTFKSGVIEGLSSDEDCCYGLSSKELHLSSIESSSSSSDLEAEKSRKSVIKSCVVVRSQKSRKGNINSYPWYPDCLTNGQLFENTKRSTKKNFIAQDDTIDSSLQQATTIGNEHTLTDETLHHLIRRFKKEYVHLLKKETAKILSENVATGQILFTRYGTRLHSKSLYSDGSKSFLRKLASVNDMFPNNKLRDDAMDFYSDPEFATRQGGTLNSPQSCDFVCSLIKLSPLDDVLEPNRIVMSRAVNNVGSERISGALRFTRRNGKGNSRSNRPILVRPTKLATKVIPHGPNSSSWVTLKRQFYADDDPILHFKPYFGDNDAEDVVSANFKLKTHHELAQERLSEKNNLTDTFLLRRLVEYLRLTKDGRAHHNLPVKDLVALKGVLMKRLAITDSSELDNIIYEPFYEIGEERLPNLKRKSDKFCDLPSNATVKDVFDSYHSLFCRACKIYDCKHHGNNYEMLRFWESRAKALEKRAPQNTENERQRSLSHTNRGSPAPWSNRDTLVAAKVLSLCNGNLLRVAALLGQTKWNEVGLLERRYRDAGLGSSLDTIMEQKRRHGSKRLKIKKRRTQISSALFKVMDSNDQDIATRFSACYHDDVCAKQTCGCIKGGHFCTKECACNESCSSKFTGCNCSRACQTKQCPCWASGRECDPDLCRGCGCSLPPDHSMGVKRACCNSSMQLGMHKHLLVAESLIAGAGWGLFSKARIKKKEFIQEYLGEVVSQEEAERRGGVYDKKNLSFLFNLNNELVIDAFRKGNKTKFANHSSKPNMVVRIVLSNGEHHIGMYAANDINAGSELTFDYGYAKEAVGNLFTKEAVVVGWMVDPSQANKIQEMKKARLIGKDIAKKNFDAMCKKATSIDACLYHRDHEKAVNTNARLFDNIWLASKKRFDHLQQLREVKRVRVLYGSKLEFDKRMRSLFLFYDMLPGNADVDGNIRTWPPQGEPNSDYDSSDCDSNSSDGESSSSDGESSSDDQDSAGEDFSGTDSIIEKRNTNVMQDMLIDIVV
jgi:hypothetical protein